jgi:hypothetical protein
MYVDMPEKLVPILYEKGMAALVLNRFENQQLLK